MDMAKFKGAPMVLTIVGLVLALVSLLLTFGGFDMLVRIGVSHQVRLSNGSDTWNQWKVIPIPVFLKVRFFNITNPDDILNGGKPKLQEMGPYVYREEIYKTDITGDEESETVRYKQIRHYFFEPELSQGTQDDLITIINVPYVGLAKLAHEFTDVDFLLTTLDDMVSSKGEQLTRRETVRDILFDGFSVQVYIDLVNDPLVQSAGEVHLPAQLKNGRMGILEGKNGSDEGWMEVKTGMASSEEFCKLVSYKDANAFSVWKGDSCNMLNGTDGILYPPFRNRGETLYALVPDLCRSIMFEYQEDVVVDGIPAYRYRQPERMYQSPELNPDNACFCPHENKSECAYSGFIYLAPCFGGAPLLVSQPHFLFVDKEAADLVEGLHPDPEKHWDFMDLHPITGLAVEAQHRLQFNMKITNWPSMPTFSNVADHIIPILWIEEGAVLVGKNKTLLKLLSGLISTWGILKYVLIFAGLIVLPGLGIVIMNLRKRADEVKNVLKSASGSGN